MIKVLLFANLKEKTGQNHIDVPFTSMNIGELKNFLIENYELIEVNLAMAAVNEEYADNNTVINDGDTVAFIPPVSGG